MEPNRKLIVVAIVSLLAIVVISTLSFKADSKQLRTIQENPINSLSLDTGYEVGRKYYDKEKFSLMGKPSYANVRLEYHPNEGTSKEELFNEIIVKVENMGWETGSRDDDLGYYRATYNKDTNYLLVKVYNNEKQSVVRMTITNRNP